MTTTPFRSDFLATDRAHLALKDAVELRKLAARFDGPCDTQKAFRSGMRIYAKEAVKFARKYREGRK